MSNKVTDFLSSFGIMLAGVFLLFFSSVYFSSSNKHAFLQFPVSGQRTPVGEQKQPAVLPVSKPAEPLAKDKNNFVGSSTAASAVVIDTKTKAVLFSKNISEVRPLASITKLMTAMVLLDSGIDFSSTTIITSSDIQDDHHINAGEKFTLEDLWHVALIGSSNSAINALVRNSGMPKEKFVGLMNEKAKELKLTSARFDEPTGLSEKNMANALDTAKMLIDALKFDKIYTTVQTGEYYAHPLNIKTPRRIWTTNWLLTNWIPNNFKVENIAGKTGFIEDSGYNFAVSLTSEKKHTISVVVFGANSNEARFSEARDLAQWTFGHYLWPEDTGYESLLVK